MAGQGWNTCEPLCYLAVDTIVLRDEALERTIHICLPLGSEGRRQRILYRVLSVIRGNGGEGGARVIERHG